MDLAPTTPEHRVAPPARDTPGAVVIDRAAAFAAGPSRIPRRVVGWFLGAVVLLGGGGAVADHFFGGPAGSPAASPQLPASLSALMQLTRTPASDAPAFSLTDQRGRAVSPAGLRGRVVVLTFFDAPCDDICPVLEAELAAAYRDLGADAPRVALVAVNTDPLAPSPSSARAAAGALATLGAWHFLTGPLPRLDAVWSAYGITVDVQRSTGAVSHNDLLYFVDPSGRLRLRATPYANENGAGRFTLSAPTIAAWAEGIAVEARTLLGEKP